MPQCPKVAQLWKVMVRGRLPVVIVHQAAALDPARLPAEGQPAEKRAKGLRPIAGGYQVRYWQRPEV